MSAMRVFVLGGTGAVGTWAVRALVAAGHNVSALARTPAKAAALSEQGAMPVGVSLFDGSALTVALAGFDAVINLATSIPPITKFASKRAWIENQQIRVKGSAIVADAAIAAGVGRVLQESVCMLYVDGGDAWLEEDAPTDHFPMAEGNHAAEANTMRFAEAGGTGAVLRFGWFYGPGAAHSEQMLALARHRLILTLGDPQGYQSSIHVADAGAAVASALHVPSGVYNIVDNEPLTKRGLADAMAAAAGRTAWVRGPGRAAGVFGDRLTSLTRSVRASNAKFRAASGWSPRYPSAREGWMQTARELP